MDTKFFYLSFFRSRSGNTEDQRKLERVEQNIRTILENVVLLASKVLLIFRIFGSLKFPLDLSSCLSCMKITTCLNSLHLMFTKWWKNIVYFFCSHYDQPLFNTSSSHSFILRWTTKRTNKPRNRIVRPSLACPLVPSYSWCFCRSLSLSAIQCIKITNNNKLRNFIRTILKIIPFL